MGKASHYPSFHVMKEKDEWDDHTQSIVASRLKPREDYRFLTPVEAEMLRKISSLLVDDDSPDVIQYVIDHIDQTMHQSLGEGQRKVGVPEASVLVRTGLKAVEQDAVFRHGTSYLKLDESVQKNILQQISQSLAGPENIWGNIPQAALFQKLLQLTVDAYCSHPKVWSVIGYGGPAYPRGYIRTQLGQLDPWEAKPELC